MTPSLEKPFWRDEPLTAGELDLLHTLFKAHDELARRANVSTWVAVNGALSSGDFEKGIAAAILTTGGTHAPLAECFDFIVGVGILLPAAQKAIIMIDQKKKVPGWGSDFAKDGPDPLLEGVHGKLIEANPAFHRLIDSVTQAMHEHGKMVWPNAGCYTAAVAVTLGIPRIVVPYLFIAGRLAAWADLILKNHGQKVPRNTETYS